tara:strand:- start:418 stop:636 length:219 start_codon:yes stop_codon:yes gene_type:complete
MSITVLDTPQKQELAKLIVLRGAMRMEVKGFRMTNKSPTAYSILKKEYGMKGNKQKVLEQLNEILDKVLEKE